MAKHTVTEYAQAPRVKESTADPGTSDLRYLECTRGPVEARTRVSGRTVKDMVSELKPVVDGLTEVNGLKVSKAGTAFDKALALELSMKEHGPTDSRTDMDPKHTLMEVLSKVNG